jgi:hypothetical protein
VAELNEMSTPARIDRVRHAVLEACQQAGSHDCVGQGPGPHQIICLGCRILTLMKRKATYYTLGVRPETCILGSCLDSSKHCIVKTSIYGNCARRIH